MFLEWKAGKRLMITRLRNIQVGKGQCFIHVHYLNLINKELVQNPQGTKRERGEWHIKIGDEDQDKGRIVRVNETQCTSKETQKEQ